MEPRSNAKGSLRVRKVSFGPFELNPRAAELRKHDHKIRLQEQPFQILLMLVEQPGEVVLREEIRKRLWPNDTIVEFDHSINSAIKRLRDALGESAGQPRYIETVARRGYRFIGEAAPEVEALETAPTIPLISREPERKELLRLLGAAQAGRGSLALISGEPGIGKTHLTHAIVAEAVLQGCFAMTGHCYEMEGAPPYVPFIEMIEQSSRVLPRDTFRNALGEAAPEVAKLAPELRRVFLDIPSPIQLPPEQQRRFMFNAYREFVERAARMSPIVAVFEDLHWADESTLLLFHHLVQAVSVMPLLMIGTYRDVELDITRPFARSLETLLREKLATRMPLRRLPQDGVEAMLELLSGKLPPPALVRIVFDETEGNPFFVEEVFRHLADEGRLFDKDGAWREGFRADQLQVPQGVRLAIGRRLERLSEEARRVLTSAAVIGRSFSLPLLEELESARPDATLDAVEQAEQAHLVEAESGGRETRYRFVHELIRQTLASALSLPRRQRLHVRVADAIEKIYSAGIDSHAPALAHHLSQAGAAADTDRAISWFTRAAKQAASTAAFEDALAHLDNALSLIGDESSSRVAELHVERATVLRSLARMPDAIAALQQTLALFQANGDRDRFAETSLPLASILSWIVRPDEAREICSRALEFLGPADSPSRVFLMYMMATQAALADDIDAAFSIVDEAQRLPVPPHPVVMRNVSQLQTYLRFTCAQLEPAYQAAVETQRLSESAGDVWSQVDVAWIRAAMAILLGRLEEGITIAREAIPLSEKIGHWGNAFFCQDHLYQRRFAAGDLECVTDAAAMLEEYERLHYVPWNVKSKVDFANVERLRGRVEEAAEWCRSVAMPGHNHWSGYPHAALALTFAQAGDPRLSHALEVALPFVPRAGHPAPFGRWPTLNLLIEALATAGRVEDAAALHPVAEEMIGLGFALMFTTQALPRTTAGIAAACARNWSRAEEHHQAAIHQADTTPLRILQPIARYWYAEMLRARNLTGDGARTRALLSEALTLFESLGMPLYARQARSRITS